MQKQLKVQLRSNKENCGFRFCTNVWRYWNDIYNRVKNKRGFTITFSGVDGAGKSTILNDTKSILEQKFRKNVPGEVMLFRCRWCFMSGDCLSTNWFLRSGFNLNQQVQHFVAAGGTIDDSVIVRVSDHHVNVSRNPRHAKQQRI